MAQLTLTGPGPSEIIRREPPRDPAPRDYWLFLVATPLLLGLFFAVVGIGPARQLGLASGFAYAGSQFLAAWWGNALGCLLAARLLPWRRPPLGLVLVVGHLLACYPLYVFFREHFVFFQGFLPEIGAQVDASDWSGDYLLRLLRYSSLPFLMLWFVSVYGFRQWTGVEIFGKPGRFSGPGSEPGTAAPSSAPAPTVPAVPESRPAFLDRSTLPADAAILALKAEEHYVRVWSTSGTDLVRCRFGDAVDNLGDLPGEQVHRSWWVRWDAVTDVQRRGRALELVLDRGLRVPVSRAYLALVRRHLDPR